MRRIVRTTPPSAPSSISAGSRRRATHGLGPFAAAACLALLLAAPGAQAASHATSKASGDAGNNAARGAPAATSPAMPAERQGHAPEMDNSGNYRQEVQACREGRTGEDLATCLKEARFAEAERRRGTLTNTGSFQENALARCQVFKTTEDKDACRARIVGHVEIEGSVAGGGILRSVAITQPAPPPVDDGSAMGAGPRPAQPGVVPSSPAPSSDIAPEGSEPPEVLPEDDPEVDPEEIMNEGQ